MSISLWTQSRGASNVKIAAFVFMFGDAGRDALDPRLKSRLGKENA